MSENKKSLVYRGVIKIGDIEIQCAVNEDGIRVISQTALNKAFDRPDGGARGLPRIIDLKALEPFISGDVLARANRLIQVDDIKGFEAELLPDICEIWLEARDAGVLKGKQRDTAKKAEIIMRALSKIGIIALIDEATGFQYNRKKDALRLLLEQYVTEGLQKWLKRFPDKFFDELDRFHGNEKTTSRNRPLYYALWINSYVWDPIEEDIKNKNPITEKGYRKNRHHQHLTDFGLTQLSMQIGRVMGIMEDSKTLNECKLRLARQKGLTIIEENLFGSQEKIIKKPKKIIQLQTNPTSNAIIEAIQNDNPEFKESNDFEDTLEKIALSKKPQSA